MEKEGAHQSIEETAMYTIRLQDLINSELQTKSTAIHGYDAILWKIRSGYMVVWYGALSLVSSKVLELSGKWPGDDCWDIYRGDEFVAYHCGTGRQALQARDYTIKPKHAQVFKLFRVTIHRGKKTTVPKK